MQEDPNQKDSNEGGVTVSSRLFAVLIAGLALVFIGIIVLFIAVIFSGGSGSIGGVVFIGPIPIVFGAGPDAGWLIIISIIIAVVTLALFIVYYRRSRRVIG